ncbi:MAG: ABC transporter permease, partial [Anaerolineae bacterium]|nr:ABC transporter permease [Anaerolineae bacterium]
EIGIRKAMGATPANVIGQIMLEALFVTILFGYFGLAIAVLILEGMAVTQYDGAGDPFSVILTPGMVGFGTPLTVYMMGINRGLDPFMFIPDQDWNILETSDGDLFACDDAGSRSCWGDSDDLAGYFVSRTNGRFVESDEADAMMSVPIDGFTDVTMDDPFVLYFAMTSSDQRTTGDYTIVFHTGTR